MAAAAESRALRHRCCWQLRWGQIGQEPRTIYSSTCCIRLACSVKDLRGEGSSRWTDCNQVSRKPQARPMLGLSRVDRRDAMAAAHNHGSRGSPLSAGRPWSPGCAGRGAANILGTLLRSKCMGGVQSLASAPRRPLGGVPQRLGSAEVLARFSRTRRTLTACMVPVSGWHVLRVMAAVAVNTSVWCRVGAGARCGNGQPVLTTTVHDNSIESFHGGGSWDASGKGCGAAAATAAR